MIDKNDPLLRELSEEVRAEQYRKIWARYRTAIIAAIAAIPLGTLAYQAYTSRQTTVAETAGARFEVARRLLAEKKTEEAKDALAEMAKDAPDGYALLARFQTAASLVKAGQTAEAVAVFDAIATEYEGTMGDLARLQAGGLRLGAADWTEMQNRLTPVTDERNAFRAVARELLGLAAMKAGRSEDARRAFLMVVGDAKASPAQKERVNAHLAGLLAAGITGTGVTGAGATDGAGKP